MSVEMDALVVQQAETIGKLEVRLVDMAHTLAAEREARQAAEKRIEELEAIIYDFLEQE